mmetsp:Transcript_16817/g.38690  ORF Transcript_16817/g.38690 Transcript_16817/m.38690 type:complete len:151 (-) Transcript_16817:194-646(-)
MSISTSRNATDANHLQFLLGILHDNGISPDLFLGSLHIVIQNGRTAARERLVQHYFQGAFLAADVNFPTFSPTDTAGMTEAFQQIASALNHVSGNRRNHMMGLIRATLPNDILQETEGQTTDTSSLTSAGSSGYDADTDKSDQGRRRGGN